MEYCIYGKNEYGNSAKRIIEDIYDEKVIGFLDTFREKYPKNELMSYDMLDMNTFIIIAVQKPKSALEIDALLRGKGFHNIYWYGNLSGTSKNSSSFVQDRCFETSKWGNSIVLPHLEVHISDICNMNCKGCTHFSPLFHENEVEFKKQIDGLKQLIEMRITIGRLDILGGEPFLSKDIELYIEKIRELFPDIFIDVFSNGLLIPNLPDELFSLLRKNSVSVSVTEYPPTRRMINGIINKLEKNNVFYRIIKSENRQSFNIPISITATSKYPPLCISDGCVTVNNGLIARCPTLMYVSKLNKEFGLSLPEMGLYKINQFSDGNELLKKMNEKVPLCAHCIKKDVKWEICGKKISVEDFVSLD